jgi:hypothetical protein
MYHPNLAEARKDPRYKEMMEKHRRQTGLATASGACDTRLKSVK